MKVTINDVAREAGVSTATVSKVINNKGKISDKTRKKVNQVVNNLSYQPNLVASALKGKGTFTIALLIPHMDNPIYAQYLKYIEERGQELGFSIVMCSTDNDPNKEANHVTVLKKKKVDGFIIASKFNNKTALNQLVNENIPVALIAHERPELLVDSVTADDYLGGYQATEHLLSLGHRKIGVIAEEATSCKERIRGYEQALADNGIEFDEGLVVMCNGTGTFQGAEVQAGKLLDRQQRPTAIFGCNDVLAVGTMQAAKARGLILPDELSVIGYDNTLICEIVNPQLSSIAMPIKEMGRKVIDLLIAEIEHDQRVKQRVHLSPELIMRSSTTSPKEKGKVS
ncbi:LacI family DNA-binding transcriptional regulator [Priestia abyssalis]|uniref:LacI family DNA-binding transcriptional regulator n=1 Tax=Priestia abyssalis TaxID=1221450 RepID=UPI0009951227|nr:LacI family DNA-binding transcriptional regulator [Priestia abyssalis]